MTIYSHYLRLYARLNTHLGKRSINKTWNNFKILQSSTDIINEKQKLKFYKLNLLLFGMFIQKLKTHGVFISL